MIYEISLDTKIVGKQRPRYNTRTHTVYTPNKTIDCEKKIRKAFLDKYGIKQTINNLKATIITTFSPPKSTSKKRREFLINNNALYGTKPDIDNACKTILDALNGVAYADDNQIVIIQAKKQYGEKDNIYIRLEEL